VVETVGLENRCTGNRTGGSNPSPSATQFLTAEKLRLVLPRNKRNVPIFGGQNGSPVQPFASGERTAITKR
jgi:hypothetical protein